MTKRTRDGNAQSPNPARTDAHAAHPASDPADPGFTPVSVRPRHDGWTPERQVGFIEALAECGCVAEACARIGLTESAAYALRRRPDAQSFRAAWDAALDIAVSRLSDAVFARALGGVARPVFFKGEQIGERRYYDERLAMFILRYRDPVRFGKCRDTMRYEREPEAASILLTKLVNRVEEDAFADQAGDPPRRHRPIAAVRIVGDGESDAEKRDAQARAHDESEALNAQLSKKLDILAQRLKRKDAGGDVA